jgi:hypothetical protein
MAKKKNPSEKADQLFNMRIKPSQKEVWESFITNSNKRFTKLSQLIRFCVNGYINGYLVENVDQNKAQLEKLLEEKNLLYNDELSKLNQAMNDIMDLILNEVVKPDKAVKGEVAKGQILTALKKGNYTSTELAKMFKMKPEYIIPQLTPLIKEGSVGRNDDNEYYLKKKDKMEAE